ncbi:MAG: DUF3365 domain-containing protein [Desulfobulbaceae bacterium]|nr:DUF3365 domain-containing protein [Desulfobulbaceae bacterium]
MIKNYCKPYGICKMTFILLLAWTFAVGISMSWNIYNTRKQTLERARIEARTIFQHNLAYRKWNTMHGGVYMRTGNGIEPNPYLHAEDRDLVTEDGEVLTMINPFQMTRETYRLLSLEMEKPTLNRTVSLDMVNPENEPDQWETQALNVFQNPDDEVSEVTLINDNAYLRLIKPYVTVEGCLKCHGDQGYDIGDFRGGMSIAVPMDPYYTQETKLIVNSIITHLLLWAVGIVSIIMLTNNIRNRQQAIENSEEKFRILAEFSNDWEYWLSEENKMVFTSPSCRQITGYREEDFINDPDLLTSIVHPQDRHIFDKTMAAADDPRLRSCQFRIIRADNSTRWLSLVWRPIYLGSRYAGKRVSNRDITDHVELREQLYQSQKMESLGVMAGGVAHDFNNILTVILGYSTLMSIKAETLGDADLKKYIETMEQAAKKSKQLIGSLLAFSRKQVMKPVPTCISEVVNTSAKLLHRLLPADISFSITCAQNELPVLVDPHQFEQVLMNLVTNGRDAMPNGGRLTIETKIVTIDSAHSGQYNLPPGRYMKIAVSDTGMGIDKEQMQRIFEPFYTTKEKGKGTGLGLAMVYGIIKQQDGTVTVQSVKGVVTVFSVYLPVISEGLPEDTADVRKPELKKIHHVGQGTIMIAEDNSSVREYLQDTLRFFGYQTIAACDGADALEQYTRNRGAVDLILLDVIMPKKNGREVYDQIRKDAPEQKILFMSGYTEEILSSKRISEEKLEFIHKPIVLEELLGKIEQLMEEPAAVRS